MGGIQKVRSMAPALNSIVDYHGEDHFERVHLSNCHVLSSAVKGMPVFLKPFLCVQAIGSDIFQDPILYHI